MYEDFYLDMQETWYDYVAFEPPYNPDDYLNYEDEEDECDD